VLAINRRAPGAQSERTASSRRGKDGQTILFAAEQRAHFRVVLDQIGFYDALRDLVPLGVASRTPSVLVVRAGVTCRTELRGIHRLREEDPGRVRIGHPARVGR